MFVLFAFVEPTDEKLKKTSITKRNEEREGEENGIKFILEELLNVMEWSGGSCSFLLRTILLSYSFICHVIWFILNNFSH